MAVFNEDSMYRMSSQYRLWSFTYGTLVSERDIANHTPAEHVRKRRKITHSNGHDTPTKASTSTSTDVEADNHALTPTQELHVLNHTLIPLLIQICRSYFAHMATNDRVRGTAAHYLRRYYLKHSLMEPIASPSHHTFPSLNSSTLMILACVYLAMKVHDEYVGLSDFVQRIRDKGAREGLKGAEHVTIEGMKNAEAQLTRTLRFCFEVRHASAGLRGLELELTLLAAGKGDARMRELGKQLARLSTSADGGRGDDRGGEDTSESKTKALRTRIGDALNAAATTLKTTVHVSDVYFLYTPSQILFAALSLADPELAHWYLSTKFPSAITASPAAAPANGASAEEASQAAFELHNKVLSTVRGCAEQLAAAREGSLDAEELRALNARLEACQRMLSSSGNDEAEGSRSVKRAGVDAGFSSSDEGGDVVRRKKRKVEDDDIFGAPLNRAKRVEDNL